MCIIVIIDIIRRTFWKVGKTQSSESTTGSRANENDKPERDWSKSIGWGETEHLEMWWIKNTWPTPSFWYKTD